MTGFFGVADGPLMTPCGVPVAAPVRRPEVREVTAMFRFWKKFAQIPNLLNTVSTITHQEANDGS
jgi:hypothetical protein